VTKNEESDTGAIKIIMPKEEIEKFKRFCKIKGISMSAEIRMYIKSKI